MRLNLRPIVQTSRINYSYLPTQFKLVLICKIFLNNTQNVSNLSELQSLKGSTSKCHHGFVVVGYLNCQMGTFDILLVLAILEIPDCCNYCWIYDYSVGNAVFADSYFQMDAVGTHSRIPGSFHVVKNIDEQRLRNDLIGLLVGSSCSWEWGGQSPLVGAGFDIHRDL